jgi:RIO kinase 1
MLLRDVENMTRYFGQFCPDLLDTFFGEEIWKLYEDAELRPDTILTGEFEANEDAADVDDVVLQIQEAAREEQERLERIALANEE